METRNFKIILFSSIFSTVALTTLVFGQTAEPVKCETGPICARQAAKFGLHDLYGHPDFTKTGGNSSLVNDESFDRDFVGEGSACNMGDKQCCWPTLFCSNGQCQKCTGKGQPCTRTGECCTPPDDLNTCRVGYCNVESGTCGACHWIDTAGHRITCDTHADCKCPGFLSCVLESDGVRRCETCRTAGNSCETINGKSGCCTGLKCNASNVCESY